ncbi:MAG: NAD(P)H-binding protein [Candidatus Velthaea sp.]
MASATMNIALFGATGGVGSLLLRRAASNGDSIRLLLRDRRKFAADLDGAHVDVVTGDVHDSANVAATIEGSDVVFSALGARSLGATTLYSAGGGNIVTAMERAGPRRLIVVTSGGAEREPNASFATRIAFGAILRNVLADMRRWEDRITRSSLAWTIVRPTGLLDTPGTGTYRTADRFMPKGAASISRADVADFLYRAASDDSTIGKIVSLSGAV